MSKPYVTPPEFGTGDVLSASLLNILVDDLNTIGGWEFRPEPGLWVSEWNAPDRDTYWRGSASDDQEKWHGWAIKNGDTLVIRSRANQGLGYTGRIFLNDIFFQNYVQADSDQEFALPGSEDPVIPLPDWEAFRISIKSPTNDSDWPGIQYAYLKNSFTFSATSLPAFTNGGASSAADLNEVANAMRLESQGISINMYQPQAGFHGNRENQDVAVGDEDWNIMSETWLEHRHDVLRIAFRGNNDRDGHDLELQVQYTDVNGNTPFEHSFMIIGNGNFGDTYIHYPLDLNPDNDDPPPLTVGTWYKMTIRGRVDPQ